MRKFGFVVLSWFLMLGSAALAQDVGSHATAGYTNNRTFLNSDMDNFKPPLTLWKTIPLEGITNARTFLSFRETDGGMVKKYLLVGSVESGTKYSLIDRDAPDTPAWSLTFGNGVQNLDFVPSYSNGVVLLTGATTSAIKAINTADGSEIWSDTTGSSTTGRYPALTTDLAIYHFSDKVAARMASTGQVLWEFSTTTSEAPISIHGDRMFVFQGETVHSRTLEGGGDWLSPPTGLNSDGANLIATEKYLFVDDPTNGVLGALRASDGSGVWGKMTGTLSRSPGIALAYDRLIAFVADTGDSTSAVEAYDPDTGDLLWRVTEEGTGIEFGSVANNVIYYYNPSTERIQARDAASGTLIWTIHKSDVRGLSASDESLFVLLADSVEQYVHANTLFFPIVADGAGQSTLLVLASAGGMTATGTVNFFDQQGNPLAFPIQGQGSPVSSVNFQIPPGASFSVQTTGGNSLQEGWIRVDSDQPLSGSSIFQFTAQGSILAEAGVADSLPTAQATAFVEAVDKFDSGVVLANPFSETANLMVRLLDQNGNEQDSVQSTLAGGAQTSKFITEVFKDVLQGVSNFKGSIQITSDIPISISILRTQAGIQFSSTPVGQAVR